MKKKFSVKHIAFTKEEQKKVIKALEKNDVKELKGDGKFKVIGSAEVVDRDGDVVVVSGIELDRYNKNPIVLFGHDYWSLPIGKTTDVYIDVIEGKNCLVFEGEFAPAEANPEAQKVRRLYDLGMLNTVSIGFITKERDAEKFDHITRSELLEISFVPVPANQEAVDIMKMKGVYDMYKELTVKSKNGKNKADDVKTTKVIKTKCDHTEQISGLQDEVKTLKQEVDNLVKKMEQLDKEKEKSLSDVIKANIK